MASSIVTSFFLNCLCWTDETVLNSQSNVDLYRTTVFGAVHEKILHFFYIFVTCASLFEDTVSVCCVCWVSCVIYVCWFIHILIESGNKIKIDKSTQLFVNLISCEPQTLIPKKKSCIQIKGFQGLVQICSYFQLKGGQMKLDKAAKKKKNLLSSRQFSTKDPHLKQFQLNYN